MVPGAPLVEPVEIGICRFFAGVAALLVDVADCEAASPRSLPEEIDSEIGRIGPRSIGIPQIGQALRPVYRMAKLKWQFIEWQILQTGPNTWRPP